MSGLNDKERQEYDQDAACLADVLPKMWWGLYRGCMEEGFTREESLMLVRAYVRATYTPVVPIRDD